MEKYIDLHTHSLKSDGSMTPAEVVQEAKRAGLAAIALSDHDTVDGLEEAIAEGEKQGVEVVPAIEFSVISKTETHILGYFIDYNNPHLRKMLKEVVELRIQRNYVTTQRLNELGFDITLEEVEELCKDKSKRHYIEDMTLEELRKFDASATFRGQYGFCGIPTLREYFELVKDTPIITNIELKTGVYEYHTIEQRVIDMVREFGLSEKIIFSSFNHFTVKIQAFFNLILR